MSDDESDPEMPDMSAPGPAVHAAPVDNADQSTDDEEDRGKTGRDFGEWLTRGLKSYAREILCPCASTGVLQYKREPKKVRKWVGRFFAQGEPACSGCSGTFKHVYAFRAHLQARANTGVDHARMLVAVNAYADSQPELREELEKRYSQAVSMSGKRKRRWDIGPPSSPVLDPLLPAQAADPTSGADARSFKTCFNVERCSESKRFSIRFFRSLTRHNACCFLPLRL